MKGPVFGRAWVVGFCCLKDTIICLHFPASESSASSSLDWHLVLQQHIGHELHFPGPQRIRDAGKQVTYRHNNTGKTKTSKALSVEASLVDEPAASCHFLSDRKTLT